MMIFLIISCGTKIDDDKKVQRILKSLDWMGRKKKNLNGGIGLVNLSFPMKRRDALFCCELFWAEQGLRQQYSAIYLSQGFQFSGIGICYFILSI